MQERLDEAIYLIELNELVKDFLRQNVKDKLVNGWITGRSTLQLETSTGIPIQIPDGTAYDGIKDAKREALVKFLNKRPWILLPNRENPFPRMNQILKGLLHFSGQPFYITSEGDIQPVQ
ncbi:hypothetical protein TVAGG3_1062730 [Trichomonas vaginalis G3]|uniref:uncharacterized protein n=1 Tax=Trichomonas vaginalis (strain ATCC PRA-98 / G3) TaxID=412133 RepID=UPI002156D33C|nr:uncharacterized protein TVAGG3_1062730 [Trichomonas vaginalis G3]KAI5483494.1 hypothetical protein TVAGG3_1062730 [Trichomonas vaginalis G3]